MLRMEIKGSLKFPNMDLTKALDHVAEKIIIPEIAGHIHAGTDLDGSPYAPLSPLTVKIKGHDRPLIGLERELVRSPYFITNPKKNTTVIGIKSVRADVAKHLQVDGVKTKSGKRFFNFFGINAAMKVKALNFIASEKNKKIKNA